MFDTLSFLEELKLDDRVRRLHYLFKFVIRNSFLQKNLRLYSVVETFNDTMELDFIKWLCSRFLALEVSSRYRW